MMTKHQRQQHGRGRHFQLLPPNIGRAMMRRKPLPSPTITDVHHNTLALSAETQQQQQSLHRTLTATDLMLYGVGCSVGAGIYCLVGIGGQLAGPSIAISFLLCGMACTFTSLCYGEFASRIPLTGSAYVYAAVTFGEYCGWLVGWFLTLGYGFTASVVAQSWANYLVTVIRPYLPSNVPLEQWTTKFPLGRHIFGWGDSDYTYTCSPLSIVIVTVCTWILLSGAKESTKFNNFMTVLNIAVLVLVVLVGCVFVEVDNLEPFAPHGMQGIAQGAGLVFFAFIGFDMVACLGEEVVNPAVNMPIGIVGSLVISATIYVSVSLAVIGMAPIALLGQDVPLVNALMANACCTHAEQLQGNAPEQCLNSATCTPMLHGALAVGGRIVSVGAIFGLTTGTFTSLFGQPRIFYRMAQDGLLFDIFGIINPQTRVPTGGIVITGIMTSMLACFVQLESLANMISLGTLMVFTFVDAGVIVLRWRSPTPSVCSTTTTPTLATGRTTTRGQQDDETTTLLSDIGSGSGSSGWQVQAMTNGGQKSQSVVPIRHPPSYRHHHHHQEHLGLLSQCRNLFVRFRGHDVTDNGIKPIVCVVLFTLSSLVTSVAVTKTSSTHRIVPWLSAAVACICALLLYALPQSSPPDTFRCPFVPLVPLIGIASNTVMMGSLPLVAWAFVLVWFVLGNALYFLYGIRHSRLGKDDDSDEQHQPGPPVRMLSLPETLPLVSTGTATAAEDDEGEVVVGSYASTAGGVGDGLEHRTHPPSAG